MKYNPVKAYFKPYRSKKEQEYRDKIDELVPNREVHIESFKEKELAYQIYNDDVSGLEDAFKSWCDPMGITLKEYKPVAYPIVHNKINVLKGEAYKREDEYSIVSFSPKVNAEVDRKLTESLSKKSKADIDAFIASIKEGKSDEELEQMILEQEPKVTPGDLDKKNFKADVELFMEFALRYCVQTQRIKSKKVETLHDLMCAGDFAIYSTWKNGKPHLEVRNVLFLDWYKAADTPFINKSEYTSYRKLRTYNDIYQDYKNEMDKETLERFKKGYGGATLGKGHDVIGGTYGATRPKYEFSQLHNREMMAQGKEDRRNVTHNKTSNSKSKSNDTLIWETHIEFKDWEKIYFLTYPDELGNNVTIPVAASFDIPKNATEEKRDSKFGYKTKFYNWVENGKMYEAEEIEVPVKHEVVILDSDIFVIYRKVPNQVIDVENPFDFNLSTFGTTVSARNARSISPVQRVLPLYMQYMYVKHKQNREIAKYKGYVQSVDVDQIPMSLGMDEDKEIINDPIKVYLSYQEEGYAFHSSSQSTNGMPIPPTRSGAVTNMVLGMASEIYQLQQLLDLIDTEIGMALGVPPQREAEFQTNSNASDNRQALIQSYHITEPYMATIDEVWRQAVEDWIKNFRQYCEIALENGESVMFNYTLPDGTKELFEVMPSMLSFEAMGLFLRSNSNRKEYNEYMLSQIQAFSQNAGEGAEIISEIIRGITSGTSPEETHRMIQIRNNQVKKEQEKMQEMEHRRQMEMLEKQKEHEQMLHEMELEKIRLKAELEGEYGLEKERMKSATTIATTNVDNDI